MERRAKFYTMDVFMPGIGTASRILYPEKIIDPLKPLLLLPEVVDPSKWKKGKPWFVDPEEKYVLRLFNHISDSFYINTDHVKPEEIRSAQDFLNPKWKGKISTEDPLSRVDESFLPPETIPRPGVKYFDNQGWNWSVTGRAEVGRRAQKLIKTWLEQE